jgi:hypothetical protein
MRRIFTWTINPPYQREVEVSLQSRTVYIKLHDITYRKAINVIGEVTRSWEDLFLQYTRISYFYRLLSTYSRVKWKLITINTGICNVTPYKDFLAVDDTAVNCNRELNSLSEQISAIAWTAFLSRIQLLLGYPFWREFSYCLDRISEQTSAIAWTAFLNRLQLLLGQHFWADFSYCLDSLSEQTSAIAWTAFLNRLQLLLGQLFWADFSYCLDSLSNQISAIAWTAFLRRLQLLFGHPF